MAISKHILDLVTLALQDRELTFTERNTIIQKAVEEGTAVAEINAVIDNMLEQRLRSYTKEELGSCPGCGHGVPLIADQCPYCGRNLEHQERQTVRPPVYVSGEDAEIIRAENIRIEQEKKQNCPKCGAPYPLVSNICSHCGYVLHEQSTSDFNIKNLISNINQSIDRLKNNWNPSFSIVLWNRMGVVLFFYALAFFILAFTLDDNDYLTFSGGCVVVAFLFTIYANNVNHSYAGGFIDVTHYMFDVRAMDTPVQVADNEYYQALYSYEKYQRQIDSLYGDSMEAKQMLDNFSSEIDNYKRTRNRNRLLLSVMMIALFLVPVFIYVFSPSAADKWQQNHIEHPVVYEMVHLTKPLRLLPNNPVGKALVDYVKIIDEADLMFDACYPGNNVVDENFVQYRIRVEPVTFVSSGKECENGDFENVTLALFDKDCNPIGTDLGAIKLHLDGSKDNLKRIVENGWGHFYGSFLSVSTTNSPEKLRQIAESACYFSIY